MFVVCCPDPKLEKELFADADVILNSLEEFKLDMVGI